MHAALADDLREYAVKRWPTANHKFRKARLAGILGLTERRVRSFWEANRDMAPRDDEVAAIKALIGTKESNIEEANRDAFAALQERIARLENIVLAFEAAQNHQAMAGEGQGAFSRRRADGAGAAAPD